MNAEEATTLCRAAKAVCPGQKFDELTPDFWHPLLEDIDFADARRALIEVAKRQPWVAPAEIRAEVFTQHHRAMSAIPTAPTPPWQLADEPHREQEWLSHWRDAVAAGRNEQQARRHANIALGLPAEDPPAIEGDGSLAKLAEKVAQDLADALALKEQHAAEQREAYRVERERKAASIAALEAERRTEAAPVDQEDA